MGAKEGGPALVEQRGVAGCNQRRRSHPLLMRGGMRAGAKGRGGYACAHSIRRQRLEAHLVHAIDSVIAHRSRLWRTCRPASLSSRHHCRDADGRGVVGNRQRPAPSSSALRRRRLSKIRCAAAPSGFRQLGRIIISTAGLQTAMAKKGPRGAAARVNGELLGCRSSARADRASAACAPPSASCLCRLPAATVCGRRSIPRCPGPSSRQQGRRCVHPCPWRRSPWDTAL